MGYAARLGARCPQRARAGGASFMRAGDYNADDTLLVRAMNWGMESCSGRRVIISSSKKPAGAGWLASKI